MIHLLGALPPFLVAAITLPDAPNVLAGAAAGICLLSRADKQKGRTFIAAVVLTATSSWFPAPAICLLAGMYVSEALFADSPRLRWARLVGAVLCLQTVLLVIDYRGKLPTQHTAPLAALALAFAVISAFFAGRRRAAADPLIVALLSLLFLVFILSVRLAALHFGDYRQAVLVVLTGFGAALAAVSVLASPLVRGGGGFYSVSQAFALDVPLDKWIGEISSVAEQEKNADDFLDAAFHKLAAELPGLEGIEWRTDSRPPKKTGGGKYRMPIACPPLTATFYRRRFASPWTWFSYYLLCRIVGEYYLSKRREEEQRAQNLLHATHQAGARITHDIKNILHVLSALAATKDDALARRQLPILRGRLETALAKLRNAPETDAAAMPASSWWQEARSRHMQTAAVFVGEGGAAIVPSALFDRALDNFLENAAQKQTPPKNIHVELSTDDNGASLRVEDDGEPIDADTAKNLFMRPVASAGGFGVALYQLSQEAEVLGYRIILEHNAPQKVVFALLPRDKNEDKNAV